MTTERKILIAIGAAVIASMVGIACFSLGVYVGYKGRASALPQQPQPARPGQPGLPEPDLKEQAPDVPVQPNRPALVGVVRRTNGATLTVATEQGPRLITLTERTKYERRTAAQALVEITLEEIEVGAGVAVYGRLSQDGRTLVADAVVLLPARQP